MTIGTLKCIFFTNYLNIGVNLKVNMKFFKYVPRPFGGDSAGCDTTGHSTL